MKEIEERKNSNLDNPIQDMYIRNNEGLKEELVKYN